MDRGPGACPRAFAGGARTRKILLARWYGVCHRWGVKRLLFLSLPLLLTVTAYSFSSGSRTGLAGSPELVPLALELLGRDPGSVDHLIGDDARILDDVRSGRALLGLIAERPQGAAAAGLTVVPIAREETVLVAHADNPLGALTASEARALFTKSVRNWNELEGARSSRLGPVTLVAQAEERPAWGQLLAGLELEGERVRADAIVPDGEAALDAIAADPRALGFVSLGLAEAAVERGVAIRILALDGILPSSASVAHGQSSLGRELFAVLRTEETKLVRRLHAALETSRVQGCIERLHLVRLATH